jgi:hypothetical protein
MACLELLHGRFELVLAKRFLLIFIGGKALTLGTVRKVKKKDGSKNESSDGRYPISKTLVGKRTVASLLQQLNRYVKQNSAYDPSGPHRQRLKHPVHVAHKRHEILVHTVFASCAQIALMRARW